MERRAEMTRGLACKAFVCFLCLSFLCLISGFPGTVAEAQDTELPVGEMISTGAVKFEARENVWKKVEPSHFPVFQGVRIRTENGLALIILPNDTRIEVGENSLFSFQRDNQFHLFQGRFLFRIPSGAEFTVGAGELSIGKPDALQAARGPLVVSSRGEETIGSIAIHSNASVTVESIRGPLSIQNRDHVVLAAISPRESVTMPSAAVSGKKGVTVAQVGETTTEEPPEEIPIGEPESKVPLGLDTLGPMTWVGIGLVGVAVIAGAIAIGGGGDGDSGGLPPVVCP